MSDQSGTSDMTSVIARVRKLLALARDKGASVHEAENAARMASELLARHQLEMSAVDVERASVDEVLSRGENVGGYRKRVPWVETLAGACARLFDGRIMVCTGLRATHVVWVGTRENTELARELFGYLLDTWKDVVRHDEYDARVRHELERGYRRAHGAGYASAIHRRVRELVSARHANVKRELEQRMALAAGENAESDVRDASRALVVVAQLANQAQAYVDEHSSGRGARSAPTRSMSGWSAGARRGQSVGLSVTKKVTR